MVRSKISMMLTTFNEESSIIPFLKSVFRQTRKPDEIVIVDAGSVDKTIERIAQFKKKRPRPPIRLIIDKGATIAQGRNIAIKNAKYDLIFSADAGTIFEKRWIETLLKKGFEAEGCDIAVGEYVPARPANLVEEVISTRMLDFSKVNSGNVHPSNRQAAYKKAVWKKIGGFPEGLIRADDDVFFKEARSAGFKFYFTRDAKVSWHTRTSLLFCLRLAFRDSKSDGFSGLIWWRRRRLLYMSQFLVLFLMALSIVASFVVHPLIFPAFLLITTPIFVFEGGWRAYKKTKKASFLVYGSLLSFLLFLAHSTGALLGAIERIFHKKERWRIF